MFLYIFMIYIKTNKQEKLYTFKIVFRNFLYFTNCLALQSFYLVKLYARLGTFYASRIYLLYKL